MKVKVHRGTAEIGGTCIEVEAQGKRLILDLGLPLDAGPDVPLPAVPGLAEGNDPGLLGVLISHPHQDHCGLAHRMAPTVPVYIGAAAHRILKAAAPFLQEQYTPVNVTHYENRRPFRVGPFTVTPYLMDHSAYDAYGFLIEADGQRLFYSGDFRGHGRKASLFEALVASPPANIDVLMLEGTNIRSGGEPKACPTESEIELEFAEAFRQTEGLSLVWTVGQNIDRLVTIFRAAKRAGRQLVIDYYTARILEATGNPKLPQGTWSDVRVFLPGTQKQVVRENGLFDGVSRLRAQRIYYEELADRAAKLVMLFRPSMIQDLNQAKCLTKAQLIFSLWTGYLDRPDMMPFHLWREEVDIPLDYIHTSGHASVPDLIRFAGAFKPKALVPIHSEAGDQFGNYFKNVRCQTDGEWWDVGELAQASEAEG